MNAQLARNVLRSHLNNITDGALKTAMEVAIEMIDESLIEDWYLNRSSAKNCNVDLHVFLGYSEEEYNKYIWKI